MAVLRPIPHPDFLFPIASEFLDDRIIVCDHKCERNRFTHSAATINRKRAIIFSLHEITQRKVAAAAFQIAAVGFSDFPERRNLFLVKCKSYDIRGVSIRCH